jgi:YkoY family integral membrane protein
MTAPEALLIIGSLILLEGLLSADNAMVLAVLVRPLPGKLRQRALLYGLIGGYVMRGLMLASVAYLTKLWWAQVAGGGYLVFLAVRHLLHARHGQSEAEAAAAEGGLDDGELPAELVVSPRKFWRTVATVEFMDLAFAVDSALVAVAMTKNIWVIYTGVFIGILMLRLAAGWFVGVMERHPRFEHVAYALVAWAGVKLLIEGAAAFAEWISRPEWAVHLPKAAFWLVTIMILLLGSIWALRDRGDEKPTIEVEDTGLDA